MAQKRAYKNRRRQAAGRRAQKSVVQAKSVGGLKGWVQRHWQEWLLAGALVMLAAVLRMNWVGTTEFKADEARLLAMALEMAEGQVALRGISSSVGLPNFPMSVWLYALPLVVWPHPYAATLFTGFLNSLAVLACYWLVRRYWGALAAIAATLLFAVSPWGIMFSRKIWAQNLLPLFVMLWVIGLALALVERKPRFIWLALVALAVAVQIHLAALALIPATLVIFIFWWRRLSWRDLLMGAGLALVTAVPFLIYLAQQRALIKEGLAQVGGEAVGFSWDALKFAHMVSVGNDLHSLVGAEQVEVFLAQAPEMERVYWLITAVLLAGLVYLGVTVWKRWGTRQGGMGLIVLVWFLSLPLFFLFWRSSPVYLHYFIALLPAPYMAAGVAFAEWLALIKVRVVRTVGWVVLMGIVYFQVSLVMSLITFVGQTATPGGFGTPLSYQLEAAETAVTLMTESGASEILAVGDGENPELDGFPAVWAVHLRDVPHRFVDGMENMLFPAAPVVVVVSEQLGEAVELYRETAVSTQLIPLRDGEGEMSVLALPGGAPEPDVLFAEQYLFSNFVRFVGHDLFTAAEPAPAQAASDASTGIWQIYWQTADNPDSRDYHIFNHLLDADGQRVSQMDSDAFTGRQWQSGDVVVSRFVLPWDDDWKRPLTMRSGMYIFDTQEPVLLLDEAGNPYTDAVAIPFEVGK